MRLGDYRAARRQRLTPRAVESVAAATPPTIEQLADLFRCQHRGEQIETLDCKPCQNSLGLTEVPVFACNYKHRTHHPKCVLSTVSTVGNDKMRPQACATCALRKE